MVVSCIDAECKESLTVRNVCPSIIQAHIGFKNSEPFTSESYEQNFDRTHVGTYEHSYQQKYESKGWTKLLQTWVAQLISPQYPTKTLLWPSRTKRSQKTDLMVTEIIQERRSRSKSNLISKGVRRDSEPSRLPRKKFWTYLARVKQLGGM